MKTFSLKIATPDGLKFDGAAVSFLCRTAYGDVEILAGHTDFIAPVKPGTVVLKTETETRAAAAAGGLLSVKKGEVTFVPTTFEYADEIDLERAKAAKEKAEAAMKNATDARELDLAQAKLSRALSRISAAGK